MVTEEQNTNYGQRQHTDIDILEGAGLRSGNDTLVLALTVQIRLERRIDEQDNCEDELD